MADAIEASAPIAADLPPPTSVARTTDANSPLLFRHWSRPTTLQYKYLYDYRRNYYDDVIDYLDRRSRGFTRELPRPQTWAERALRTYTHNSRTAAAERRAQDAQLLQNIRVSNNYYIYHSRDYITRRYPSLLL